VPTYVFSGCVYVHATVISAGVPKAYDCTDTLFGVYLGKTGNGNGTGDEPTCTCSRSVPFVY
jgi:hypothetical protein